MKKAQRKVLAATLLQRHVRGWRVRSKFPLAQWRRDRALRKVLVPKALLLNIDNLLKAYVLQDAREKFFFPANYDKKGRNAVLERAKQLGFDCGEEINETGQTVAFVQQPPANAGASADASAPQPAATDTPAGSSERAATVPPRTATSANPAANRELFASAAPPAAEPQTTARAGAKAKARWRPLGIGGDAGASVEEDASTSAHGAAPAEPPRAAAWKAEAVPGRKAAQELAEMPGDAGRLLAEMTGYPVEGCLRALEVCNFDSNAAANLLLARGPPSPLPSGPAPAPPPQQQQQLEQSQRPPDALTELTADTAAAAAAAAAAATAAATAAAAPAPGPLSKLPPATLFRVSHTLLSATLSGGSGSRPGGGTLQMRVPSTVESRRLGEQAPLLLFDQDRRQLHGVFAATGSISDDGVLHFRPVKPPPPHHATPLSSRHTPLIVPPR